MEAAFRGRAHQPKGGFAPLLLAQRMQQRVPEALSGGREEGALRRRRLAPLGSLLQRQPLYATKVTESELASCDKAEGGRAFQQRLARRLSGWSTSGVAASHEC